MASVLEEGTKNPTAKGLEGRQKAHHARIGSDVEVPGATSALGVIADIPQTADDFRE
jgi:hypothetical protein